MLSSVCFHQHHCECTDIFKSRSKIQTHVPKLSKVPLKKCFSIFSVYEYFSISSIFCSLHSPFKGQKIELMSQCGEHEPKGSSKDGNCVRKVVTRGDHIWISSIF